MKKFVSTDLGGAPVHKNDLRDVFNSELWEAMQATYSMYDTSTEGVVVSGCSITPNGANPANFDITPGIVYINGEFMRSPNTYFNQTFPMYIGAATAVNDLRTFADMTTHAVMTTKNADVFSSPRAGQNILISSFTSVSNRTRLLHQNSIQFIIDGGGAVINAGHKGHQVIRWDCRIQGCMVLSEVSGSIVINLWKDTYANFPPTVADSIVASAKPMLVSSQKSSDNVLTGWTLDLKRGDIVGYNVESAASVLRVTVDIPVLIK